MSEKAKPILVADDEGSVARVLRYTLENEGYLVDVVTDGQKALDRIREQQPAVLITDVMMPFMTGTELCLAIQDEFPQRRFLIIIMTSKTVRDELVRLEGIENIVFFEKPLSPRQLKKVVADYLGGKDVSSGRKIYV